MGLVLEKIKSILWLGVLLLTPLMTIQAIDIQGRVAYFLPQDKHIRSTYGRHGYPEYELEVSQPIDSLFCYKCQDPSWSAWGNLSFFRKKGHSSFLKNKTEISNWALNFGIKQYICHFFGNKLRTYLGFGIGLAHVNFHDQSSYVKKHINKYGFAFLGKSGLEYNLGCNIFLDLFVDYAYSCFHRPHSKKNILTHRVNTGGLKLGLGFGYHF